MDYLYTEDMKKSTSRKHHTGVVNNVKVFDYSDKSKGTYRTVVVPLDNFNLTRTLECGQSFRHIQYAENYYSVVSRNKVTTVFQEDSGKPIVFFCPLDDVRNFWLDYFDLNQDYNAIINSLSLSEDVLKYIDKSSNIHILKQDAWEMCISFIISQRNRIENISNSVRKLCLCSNTIENTNRQEFPSPDVLNSLSYSEWESMSLGYRLEYVKGFVEYVQNNPNYLTRLSELDTESLLEYLKTFKGIGDKVANCIALYGFNRLECFPIDTWILKIIQDDFRQGIPIKDFKNYAGIIQQHMFDYKRNIASS